LRRFAFFHYRCLQISAWEVIFYREVFLIALLLLLLGGCDQIQQVTQGGDGGNGNGSNTTTQPSNSNGNGKSGGGLFSGITGGGSDTKIEIGKKVTQPGGIIPAVVDQGPAPGITWSQCNDITDGGPVNGPDCVTADISCGETVVGHTKGGVKYYNTKYYEKKYCWPATTNRSGGDERIYRFVVDRSNINHRFNMRVTFDTPCAELDIALMESHDNARECPTINSRVQVCDVLNRKGKSRVTYKQTVDPGEIWYFLVEGRDSEEGAFSFTLECLNDPAYNYYEDFDG